MPHPLRFLGMARSIERCALDVATEFCPGQGCAQTGKPRSGYGPGLLRVTTAKWRERMNAEVEAVGSDDDYSRREFGPIERAQIAARCFALQLGYVASVLASFPWYVSEVLALEHGIDERRD